MVVTGAMEHREPEAETVDTPLAEEGVEPDQAMEPCIPVDPGLPVES